MSVNTTKLGCAIFQDAQIMPFSQGRYAAYTRENTLIRECLCIRDFGLAFKPAERVPVEIRLPKTMIFGGFLFKHFGHFLLESLARLWFAKDHPDIPLVWLGRDGLWLDFQTEILQMLGINNATRFIDHPVCIHKLLVPEPGYLSQSFFAPSHADFLAVQDPVPTLPGKRIYLSRRHFGGESCLTNEAELERLLVQNGFHIYYPEKHSVQEQLTYLSSAEKILSLEGSALHSLILLRQLKAQILLIPRPKTELNHNFLTIAQRKGFCQSILPSEGLYQNILPVHQSHVQWKGELNLPLVLERVSQPDWSPYAFYGSVFSARYS